MLFVARVPPRLSERARASHVRAIQMRERHDVVAARAC